MSYHIYVVHLIVRLIMLILYQQKHKHYTDSYHTIGHRCSYPGCGDVLVPDGNMKNNQEMCFAVEAGYTEFSGLPGQIQTGCPSMLQSQPFPKGFSFQMMVTQ